MCLQKAESLQLAPAGSRSKAQSAWPLPSGLAHAAPGKDLRLALHLVRQQVSDRMEKLGTRRLSYCSCAPPTENGVKMKRLWALEVMETNSFINLAHVEITGEHGEPSDVKSHYPEWKHSRPRPAGLPSCLSR